MTRFRWIMLAAAALLVAAGVATAEKIKVEKADDLPRHTYHIDLKPSEVLTGEVAYEALAAEVRKDTEEMLATYHIQDKKTLQGLYSMLQQIHFAAGEYDAALGYLEKARALEEKEAQKLMMGVVGYAWVDALESGEPGPMASARPCAKTYTPTFPSFRGRRSRISCRC